MAHLLEPKASTRAIKYCKQCEVTSVGRRLRQLDDRSCLPEDLPTAIQYEMIMSRNFCVCNRQRASVTFREEHAQIEPSKTPIFRDLSKVQSTSKPHPPRP